MKTDFDGMFSINHGFIDSKASSAVYCNQLFPFLCLKSTFCHVFEDQSRSSIDIKNRL